MILRCFAVLSYLAFLASFLGFAALVSGLAPGRPAADPPLVALAIDLALVTFFGVTHSVMARASFKRHWTRVVPAAAERSVYVLVASLQLGLLAWQWRPVGGPALWQTGGALAAVITAAQLAGFGLAFVSTWLIDHFELFGLRQAFAPRPAGPGGPLRTPSLYRVVRHPLYLGLLLACWAAPAMTLGRLALALGLTLYVAVGVRLEERDLVRAFGDDYRAYQRRVPMILPRV